jgi:hypothetical protein
MLCRSISSALTQDNVAGKQKRLKQAKEEAQTEVDAYKSEREKLYKEHETKVRTNEFVLCMLYVVD